MSRDILTVIQDNVHTFSKGQRKIASFILESYDKAAFMTASRLGQKVGVSESAPPSSWATTATRICSGPCKR